ncbi:Gfo/Idh/MocA family oxidoreductase [Maribacter polysiphoniae]|uniref:Gfo/Idh/MocA family oxidoreductase n=1 Tax=Maribacter polysiphoniae TaxID=429344 RepID=A0A316E054_9FLAO|nr:Gfo/Idh/MocA family oxidoreductase [Maribacter polysiphoniae]MBD1261018.1 Gfo/Idh/MocA family oxidoreductase [Maribacter polysiphoniae]PWK23741.1 putative dehydrogenase [Maribacter polysiphoniae]
MEKVQWGVLGAATIAVEQVIPAMLKSKYCNVLAIASRNKVKAQKTAEKFGISKCYEGYQELLNDADIEAVYIPLPNHLHVEWAIKALKAGKHVLVEKPAGMNAKEVLGLQDEAQKNPGLKVMEAFMYKFHPQWVKAKELIDSGEIGTLKTIQSSFSFFDDDATSITNRKSFGGGSLMDIGCYSISISRLLFGEEPKSVMASIEYHPEYEVDILASGILEFEQGNATFFCATQLDYTQQAQIFGTKGSIRFEIPFNPPNDRPSKMWLTKDEVITEIEFEICDQYTLQADAFSLAILEDKATPVPLDDAIDNLTVIGKLHESHRLGSRVTI